MFFLSLYGKALLLGFTNGLYIGRRLRHGHKQKYIRGFFNNKELRSTETEGRIRDFSSAKESRVYMVQDS